MNKLSEPVLALNKGYQAIHVIEARKAVSLLYQGAAEAIDDDYNSWDYKSWCEISAVEQEDDRYNYLHSPSVVVKIPHVVRMTLYERLPIKDVMFNRKNIYARDRNTCQYCGKRKPLKELTFDHIIPRSRGGRNTFENIVTCCKKCNHKKGNRTPKESNMVLIKRPVKPRWRSYVKIPFSRLKEVKLQLWQTFLHKPMWEVEK